MEFDIDGSQAASSHRKPNLDQMPFEQRESLAKPISRPAANEKKVFHSRGVSDLSECYDHSASHNTTMAKYKDVYAVLNPDLEPVEHFDKPFNIVAKERFEHKLLHA